MKNFLWDDIWSFPFISIDYVFLTDLHCTRSLIRVSLALAFVKLFVKLFGTKNEAQKKEEKKREQGEWQKEEHSYCINRQIFELDGNVVCIAIPMLLFRCDLEPHFLAVAVTSVLISQAYEFAV